MSEPQELPDFLKPITKFCNIYEKLDTNEYVISHLCLYHVRHIISVTADEHIMLCNNHHNYKVQLSKNKFISFLHDDLNSAIQKNIDIIIDNIKRYYINYTDIKPKPFGITKTKVEQVGMINEAIENGTCSVNLMITVYDNWFGIKRIKQSIHTIIEFVRNEIRVTVCNDDIAAIPVFGISTAISNVDNLIGKLVSIQDK